jgi:hypothetical protein
MVVATDLAKKGNRALLKVTEALLPSECFKAISAMETFIYEEGCSWNELIKVINSQHSSHDDEVRFALKSIR